MSLKPQPYLRCTSASYHHREHTIAQLGKKPGHKQLVLMFPYSIGFSNNLIDNIKICGKLMRNENFRIKKGNEIVAFDGGQRWDVVHNVD